jgi:pimeloyl-ACP methyl ester carboxylesterase
VRYSPAAGASRSCTASPGRSGSSSAPGTGPSTPRVARNFTALFPSSELHLLDDAGHFVQVDQPRRVADLIAAK